MNVLLVAPDYPPTNRSSSLRAYFLAQAFAEAGHDVLVLAEPAAGGEGLPRKDHPRIAVHRMPAAHRAIWLAKALASISRMALAKRRFDVVVSTSGPFLAHAVGRWAAGLWPDTTWIADYRDLWASGNYYERTPGKPSWSLALRQRMERAIVRRAALVTTVTRGLAANLGAFHGRDVRVFYNGYEPGIVQVPTDAAPADPATIRICHTGTMYRERSPRDFLEVFRRVHAPGGMRRLEIVLAGRVDDTVAAELRDFEDCAAITYAGVLSREEAYRLQRSADYCLLVEVPGASRMGVLAAKVFEYMGMRKRIIAFAADPASEVATLLGASGLLAFCGTGPGELETFLSELASGDRSARATPDDAFIARFDRTAISRDFVAAVAAERESRRHAR